MREDYRKIKKLIERNDFFYKKNLIKNREYALNNLLFAEKLDKILHQKQRNILDSFISDEFSLTKFNLSVAILKAVPN